MNLVDFRSLKNSQDKIFEMFLDAFRQIQKKVKAPSRQETSKEVRVRTQYQAMSGRTLDHCAIRPKT
jgi:hypothetical protein